MEHTCGPNDAYLRIIWAMPRILSPRSPSAIPCHSPFPPREQWLAVAVRGAVVDVVDVVEVVVRHHRHRCSRTFIPRIPVPIPCLSSLSHPFFPRVVVVETCK